MSTAQSKSPRWLKLLRRNRRGLERRWRSIVATFRSLGPRGAALFWSAQWGLPFGRDGGLYRLHSRDAAQPLLARAGTSDGDVFRNVFIEQAYGCLEEGDDIGLILDCGANVGYASAYFLSRYPSARVVAVEPDEGNYEMLRLNTAAYGERIEVSRAAVWSHPARLVVVEDAYRDGREWSRQVREASPEQPDGLPAVTIDGLLRDSGCERISILKIDIEGAEAVVFSDGYQAWLANVENLLIELHDDSAFGDCRGIFHRAIADQDFTVSQVGNLTICKRPRPAA